MQNVSKKRATGTKGVLWGYLEGQICPEKGTKGPFSVKFGSLLALKGLKRAQNDQRVLKRAQKVSKGAQNVLKMRQNASQWAKMVKMGQNGSK